MPPTLPITDTHQLGLRLADALARTIQWLEPLDPRTAAPRGLAFQEVWVGTGPVAVRLGVVRLTGHFRSERGEDHFKDVAVQHKDKIILFAIEVGNHNAVEKQEWHEILRVARRALGGEMARHTTVSRELLPEKVRNIASGDRWEWNYNRMDNPKGL